MVFQILKIFARQWLVLSRPQLKEAMINELDELCTNGTWEEAISPPGSKVVSTRCFFKIKYNSLGELDELRLGLWQEDLLSDMVWISARHILRY